MLIVSCFVLVLFVVGVWAVARGVRTITARLGVDLLTALVWFGLAEWPNEEPRAQRQRLEKLLLEPSWLR